MKNPSKFIKSYANKFKSFKLTPLEMSKFLEVIKIVSNASDYELEMYSTPEEIIEKRRKMCQACEFSEVNTKKYGKSDPHCAMCGCKLASKTSKSFESCPLKKWDTYDETIKDQINASVEIINNLIQDENWINLLSIEEQFEINYQEAIQKLEKDSSTDLVDELIAQSESEEEIENE